MGLVKDSLNGAGVALMLSMGAATVTAQAQGGNTPPPTIDTDNDGTAEAWDLDSNGQADAWDTTGDGKPDTFDLDGDGRPDPQKPKR